MGTNYYWTSAKKTAECAECGNMVPLKLHIGKSSGGWCFALKVHPEHGIADLPDWEDRWPQGVITNEYGDTITPEDMRLIVLARASTGVAAANPHWLERNHAEPGPAGLVRHKIDGRHCIGHGDGTYDIMQGSFS